MRNASHEPFDWDLGVTDSGFTPAGTLRRLRRLTPTSDNRRPPAHVDEPPITIKRFLLIAVFVIVLLGLPAMLITVFG